MLQKKLSSLHTEGSDPLAIRSSNPLTTKVTTETKAVALPSRHILSSYQQEPSPVVALTFKMPHPFFPRAFAASTNRTPKPDYLLLQIMSGYPWMTKNPVARDWKNTVLREMK